jgi:hypothetical protein
MFLDLPEAHSVEAQGEPFMHRFVLTAIALGFSAATAFAQPDTGAFPRDEASLRALDNAQLRIVRRAGAQCFHSGERGFLNPRGAQARACIISLTENAIRTSDDPALRAYHQALPFQARYDEYRAGYYWQRFLAAN